MGAVVKQWTEVADGSHDRAEVGIADGLGAPTANKVELTECHTDPSPGRPGTSPGPKGKRL